MTVFTTGIVGWVVPMSEERRFRDRLPVHLPLRYSVLGEQPVKNVGTGRVINMSSKGIAFTSDHTFESGAMLQLSIKWPALLENKIRLRLVVEGRVVRSDGRVTAAEIVRYEFRTQK